MVRKQERLYMSSKDNVKFEYRIVVNDDPEYPYVIEKKGWIFWHRIIKSRNMDTARSEIRQMASQLCKKPGTVIEEFTHEDYLVEKLKQ